MFRLYSSILISAILFSNCQSESESTPVEAEKPLTQKDLSGMYKGYKVFNKSTEDSSEVSLQLNWISDNKMKLEEITPYNYTTQIEMDGFDFVYDRGIGEDECGATSLTGTGNFKGTQLYLIETIKCVNGNGPDKFMEYRVKKIQ
ncbi:hypothetical protein FEM33_03865 [Dyadobacter flavalbus]|uniref:Lipocalin-like domain-containing protein n=1 Tax=Dyadobacter flavalbus TaxID=2579942 RepID=A0A5M8QXT5_9BACT|nr:hypothetical protein [Dyadobacter flavalbus]KAA6441105.1 hypothetical protein FEM33_03865 [Dyadobacter flavalbus]